MSTKDETYERICKDHIWLKEELEMICLTLQELGKEISPTAYVNARERAIERRSR